MNVGIPAPGVGRNVVGYAVDGDAVGLDVDGRGVGAFALYVGNIVGTPLGLCCRKNFCCSGVILSTG